MSWATDPLNRLTGAHILFPTVESDNGDDEVADQWNDIGGNWWEGAHAPSFRGDSTEPAASAGN